MNSTSSPSPSSSPAGSSSPPPSASQAPPASASSPPPSPSSSYAASAGEKLHLQTKFSKNSGPCTYANCIACCGLIPLYLILICY